jgi:outer membrane biosynthesis protein TonB
MIFDPLFICEHPDMLCTCASSGVFEVREGVMVSATLRRDVPYQLPKKKKSKRQMNMIGVLDDPFGFGENKPPKKTPTKKKPQKKKPPKKDKPPKKKVPVTKKTKPVGE